MSTLDKTLHRIREFRDARDWARFHNPKDMAIAISIEASELLEHFLWKDSAEVDARVDTHREAIAEEIADIAIYLGELADNLGIDLVAAMNRKIDKNAVKYPVERVKGSALKYNEYPSDNTPSV